MRSLFAVALAVIGAASGGAAEQAGVTITWSTDVARPAVDVIGLPAQTLASLEKRPLTPDAWTEVFAVYAGQLDLPNQRSTMPAIAGTWRIIEDRLRFEPRFPFEPGLYYRAEYRPEGAPAIVSTYQAPRRASAPTTTVTLIHPTADMLPENQLKFYVQFSAPMSRGRIYEHIRLRDAKGREIELPFLELDEELWDPAMTRLTLLIDPGRIKRGVKPLEDIGAVFEQGHSYSLTIAATCEDAAGLPLRAGYEKKFRIGPADRVPPDPARWKITAPPAQSRDALVVAFDEPMDHALALRLITVETDSGAVAGDALLTDGDRRWTFTPSDRWRRGEHRLIVATKVEDLAGNNIGKSFDVDLAVGMQRRLERVNVSVPFPVK